MNEIEELWYNLLSQEPERILAAFHSLDRDEQGLILKHLARMIKEEGWQPSQRDSAQAALDALGYKPTDNKSD